MSVRSSCLFLCLSMLLFVPFAVQAADPPHDATNNVGCTDCHRMTSAGGILVIDIPRGPAQADVCNGCHEGIPSLSVLANHVVNDETTVVDCGSCHDPHGPDVTTDPHTDVEAPNLNLIRKKMRNVEGALDLAIFQQAPRDFAFGEADDPWNGICQTCHTGTAHHTNDDSGDHQHEIGGNCVSCHSHANGFMASGGSCTGCHSSTQGSRRAVATEFPADNAHAHYGANVDSGCLVCHSVDTHMNGYVELIDPDDGTIYSFQSPEDLTADPDLSDFCAACHDDDGAQILAVPLDPFGNGNIPPDVATRFLGTLQWEEDYGDFCFGYEGTLRQVNSHHDISDGDQAWSGSKLECLNCHGAHNASADTPIADPSDQTQPWTGDINSFCMTCHYGGNGPLDPGFPIGTIGTDVAGPTIAMRGLDAGENCANYNLAPWWVDYTWTNSPHGLDSKRYWPGYPNLPGSDAVLDCTACHDSHGSYTATNPLGNPYMIRDYVEGSQYIDDGNRPNPATWAATPGTDGSVLVTISGTTVDWGSSQSLCIKCHATWLDSYSWHSMCNGCQTCHGHGQSWDGADWGDAPDDSTRTCIPPSAIAQQHEPVVRGGMDGVKAPVSHDNLDGQSCSECHLPHN